MTVVIPVQPEVSNKKPQKRKGSNYAHIHRDPLPLSIFPLPSFHPTHPLSLIQLVWIYFQQWVHPPSSQPTQQYVGYLSIETRSVHVTHPQHVRALWEKGFFGKGTLSRSEPTWIDRERARLAARSQGGLTAEEATKARREERRLFKLERARLERERIDTQRKIEQGIIVGDAAQTETDTAAEEITTSLADEVVAEAQIDPLAANSTTEVVSTMADRPQSYTGQTHDVEDVTQQEYLQLTLEEAYFLSFGLGILSIFSSSQSHPQDLSLNNKALFTNLQQSSKFGSPSEIAMDDQFILNYVVYHHFRSLGWVVRPGVKFSIDYLLYNRGPVFSHAEFAILIMPSYSDEFWHTSPGMAKRRLNDQKNWWWLHCINRVQSQVKKTLVLCFVDIPAPQSGVLEEQGVGAFLRRYKVREFIVRRWLMNRSRD